jgi:hypothetical protein
VGEGTGAAVSEETTNPAPADNADEAVQQAQEIRARVDQDLRTLEARLPDPQTVQARAKMIGGAVVGGVATLGAVTMVVKRRSARSAEEKEAQRQAQALAAALPDAALQVHQEKVTITGQAGRLGLLVALAALGVAIWSKLSTGQAEEPDIWGPGA